MAEINIALPPVRRTPAPHFKEPALPGYPRKRARHDDVISSDPPLFSSDDLPEAAENYGSERSKRLREGPWWKDVSQPAGTIGQRRKKRQFTRNLDSGIWMGSEGTEYSEEDQLREESERLEAAADGVDCPPEAELPVSEQALTQNIAPSQGASEALSEFRKHVVVSDLGQLLETRGQYSADRIVQTCVESGKEDVDLSGLGLRSLSPALLKSLQLVTKWPPGQDYPSQESFAPLTPNIRLFLSMNSLRSLPFETFNVERLTFLSLRRNKLQSLPPAISRLVNLEELNVAGNRLNYLPWELLKLVQGKLKRLLLYPNPFIEADVTFPEAKNDEEQNQLDAGFFPGGFDLINSNGSEDGDGPTPKRTWKPLCLGKGSIAYLSNTGQPIRDSNGAFIPSCISPVMAQPGSNNETKPINFSSATRVPSLTELALLRCSESSNLHQLSNCVPSDTSLEVLQLLETATKVKDEGGKSCSVCGRKVVIARSEWIEWWDCIPPSDLERPSRRRIDTLPIPPLLRQGCSWLCTGEQAAEPKPA